MESKKSTTSKKNEELFWQNPEFLKMKLFNIRELTIFGVGEDVLYSWFKNGTLKPTTKIGVVAKFKYSDFINACESVNMELENKKNNEVQKNTKNTTKKTTNKKNENESNVFARVRAKHCLN